MRTKKEDKERAAEILDELGTNLSSVVNMLLKQIIITEGIPFDVSIHPDMMVKSDDKKILIEHFNCIDRASQRKVLKELTEICKAKL